MQRGELLSLLPTTFDGDTVGVNTNHIVVGDFNVTFEFYLDKNLPGIRHPVAGRAELCSWFDPLRLLNSWQFKHPDERHKNR